MNLAHASWELGTRTVCSFSSDNSYQPLLWALLAILVHVCGAATVYLRVRLYTCEQQQLPSWPIWQWSQLPFAIRRTVTREVQLTCRKPRANLKAKQESLLFIMMSWITSISTVTHIVYGTIIFSGTLFISMQDALVVAVLYFISTSLCRIVLMFEISGMRHTTLLHRELQD